jgi:hypothetical protein
MQSFIDPRTNPLPSAQRPVRRFAAHTTELAELHGLCRDGRLYDIERWIASGQPLQCARTTSQRRATSALEIALDAGNHALVLLLLSNGYDANEDVTCPLDVALRSRRYDLVTLLLDCGTDPSDVDLDDLFGTYNSELFERFHQLGVDFCDRHALALAIAHHTSNKPLLGFAKRHRATHPRFQKQLDIALAHHAAEGNEKGVQLCLWAGANPHTSVPSLRFSSVRTRDHYDEDDDLLSSAIYEACLTGREEILKRFHPDPSKDDFEELWRAASSIAIIDLLATHGLPKHPGAVIQQHLWWVTFGSSWSRTAAFRHLFQVGVRWSDASADEIANLRRSLLKAPDSVFADVLTVPTTADYCSSSILVELARTSSMLARLERAGFIPSGDNRERSYGFRPTRSREMLQKLGVQVPRPKRPQADSRSVPRSVRLGPPTERVQLSREELFQRVWANPVATVAKECGVSGRGLKKICERMEVPVPPRGYWAKLSAGKPVRQARLPAVS